MLDPISMMKSLLMVFLSILSFSAGAFADLGPATDHRVVYMGDSITQFWGNQIPGIAADDVINRGISGQTTTQMLARFQSDVIALHPKVVHILAGTNDIAGNGGPITAAQIEANLDQMASLADAQGILVVFGSLLPVSRYPWSPSVSPIPIVHSINSWLQDYCADHGYTYVDYFSAMQDGQGGMRSDLSADGVHPNVAGYAIMIPLAHAAILSAITDSTL